MPKVTVTVAGQSASAEALRPLVLGSITLLLVFCSKKESVNGPHLTVAVTEINSAGMVFQWVWLDWF